MFFNNYGQLSQNHRKIWVVRDLEDCLVPNPLPQAGTFSTIPGCSNPQPTQSETLLGIRHPQINKAVSFFLTFKAGQLENLGLSVGLPHGADLVVTKNPALFIFKGNLPDFMAHLDTLADSLELAEFI